MKYLLTLAFIAAAGVAEHVTADSGYYECQRPHTGEKKTRIYPVKEAAEGFYWVDFTEMAGSRAMASTYEDNGIFKMLIIKEMKILLTLTPEDITKQKNFTAAFYDLTIPQGDAFYKIFDMNCKIV